MTETLRGTYSDKQHPETTGCEIHFEPEGIHIRLTEEPYATHFWNVDQIWTDTHHNDTLCILRYSSPDDPILKIYARRAKAQLVRHYAQYAFAQKEGTRYLAFSRLASIFAAVALLSVVAYFVLLPLAVDVAVRHFPSKLEQELGEKCLALYTLDQPIDSAKSELVQTFFDSLHWEKTYPYRIVVIGSDNVNAFALPAGHIVVLRPILNELDSYESFAALLAHESAHVELRHPTKSLVRGVSTSLILALALGDAGGVGNILLQNAEMLNSLTYSRRMERQADLSGACYLAQAGVDPRGMIRLMEVFKKHASRLQNIEFINSHPALDTRIDYIREQQFENKLPETAIQSDTLALKRLWEQIKQ